tara:strand:+ start:2856 stop:4133 length:1278 start_codon:yes stop_codon:yes gene_type:complete
MAEIKEIGYFNSIFIKGDTFEQTDSIHTERYLIEESRIKGGFNETSMDLGVRAYLADDEYSVVYRKNAMIYSGIYNAKTAVNELNQFPIGSDITKAVDITDGSIQKLHAEDRELVIFQEDKVNAAGINKDFIFTAEGKPLSTTSNVVIGEVRTYLGVYGISLNPESFAVKGNRKYFTDRKRGVVLRLTRDGLTEISNYGMRDYFKDNLKSNIKIVGLYDNVKDQYVLHLKETNKTLGYDETSRGWTSFYSYYPEAGFTLNNALYTFYQGNVWEHYKNSNYNTFYGQPIVVSSISLVMNTDGSVVKNFKTLSYEGTSGWAANEIKTDLEGTVYSDVGQDIAKYEFDFGYDSGNELVSILPTMFEKKENKYFSLLQNNASAAGENELLWGSEISGIKGMYLNTTLKTIENSKQELFAVSSEVVISSK